MPANTEHPAIRDKQPEHPTQMKVWRYLKLPNLVSLLQKRTLHFTKLGMLHDDLFEGTYPTINQVITDLQMPEEHEGDIVDSLTTFVRENTYVNCWSGNQKESAAMWRLYGTSPGSVAIQSTYEKLVTTLPNECYVAMVRYLDYDREHFPAGNLLYPGFHKRIEFEFEREIRALRLSIEGTENDPVVDLNDLIEQINMRATEEQWMMDVVKGLLDQHSLGDKLVFSNIDASPTRIRANPEMKQLFQQELNSQQGPDQET